MTHLSNMCCERVLPESRRTSTNCKAVMVSALLALSAAFCPAVAMADQVVPMVDDAGQEILADVAPDEQIVAVDGAMDQMAVADLAADSQDAATDQVALPGDGQAPQDDAAQADETIADAPSNANVASDELSQPDAQSVTQEDDPAAEEGVLANEAGTEGLEQTPSTPDAQDASDNTAQDSGSQAMTSQADDLLQASPDSSDPLQANKWATGKWDVRKINGTYYRFWLSQDGESYKGGLVHPDWGTAGAKAGYYAWAREDGIIVTGSKPYTNGTYVWLADNDGRLLNLGWNVTGYYTGGLQRYYIVDEGVHAAKIGLDTGSGAGNWAHYTLKEGYVLRGKYKQSASVTYVADNNGKLPTTSGWLVTDIYDGGYQRYYISNYGAKTGTFAVDGARYLGIENAGYVMRGYDSTHLAFADNNGKLSANSWLVTNKFGQGFQRYWMGSDGLAIRDALTNPSVAGYRAYARPEGYVVRGKYTSGKNIYLADNDGRLAADGWVVSAAYGDGLQRYYISSKTHSAVAGYSTEGYAHYTLPQGYVLRGAHQSGDWVYLADNDGRMPTLSAAGWQVSSAYGSGLQRYYLEKAPDGAWAAKVGYSASGFEHYTVEGVGYVLRNKDIYIQGHGWLQANNDGLLTAIKSGVTAIIEKYLGWAVSIANDESHGYSQLDRWGPADYDCSSYVLTALKYAGLDIGEATYTGNMRSELCPRGWNQIRYNGDPKTLVRGDILLHDVNHVEFYLGNNMRIGAHEDENGGIGEGARPGDQTGKEICTRNTVGNWFTWVLRLARA